MSDLDFELNIDKYTTKELEELLDLKFPYTAQNIKEHISILQKKVLIIIKDYINNQYDVDNVS